MNSLLILTASLLLGADEASPATQAVGKSLQQLNDAFVSRDAGVLKKLMTADHISITPYGGKQSREKQIQALPNYKIDKYSTDKMKAQTIARDVVLLSYQVNYTGTYGGTRLPAHNLAISLWVQRDGRWQEVLYQETPLGKD